MALSPGQYSLRSAFALPILMGAYFHVRSGSTLTSLIGWSLLWATAAALVRARTLNRSPKPLPSLKRVAVNGAATGALVTFLLTCPVAIEWLTLFAMQTKHEYWNWYRDWPTFSCYLLAVVTAGAGLGALSATAISVSSEWFRKTPRL